MNETRVDVQSTDDGLDINKKPKVLRLISNANFLAFLGGEPEVDVRSTDEGGILFRTKPESMICQKEISNNGYFLWIKLY